MEMVSICHCLGLPDLPYTCGVQIPAVSWKSAPILGSQSCRSPFRLVPVSLGARCSCLAPPLMVRRRPKAAAGFPAVCACTVALIGSCVELLTAQRQTVRSCSFKPKPMFAGSEHHNWVSTVTVQCPGPHLHAAACCSMKIKDIKEFKSSRCNCLSINRQTHEWLREKCLNEETAARGNQVWHPEAHVWLFFRQQQTLSLMLGNGCGFK